MIDEQIRQLDDASAGGMLSRIAQAHLEGTVRIPHSRELAESLNEALVGECEAATDPDDGEAARLALMLLAQDDRFAGPIETMLATPVPEGRKFGIVASTALAAGIIFALQTHFKFERKEDGRWSVKLEKKPTNNALLTPLVKKLMSIIGQ